MKNFEKEAPQCLFLIGAHQLFPIECLKGHQNDLFVMVEDRAFELKTRDDNSELKTRDNNSTANFKYHKQRLVFQLSSMRHYAKELKHNDFNVVYFELKETDGFSYESLLAKVLNESSIKKINCFEFEDRDRENRLYRFCEENKIELHVKPSPAFMVSRKEFQTYLKQERRPLPSTFYEQQRKRLQILMEPNGQPVGGIFTFHDEKRLKWPGKMHSPKIPVPRHDEIDKKVIKLVDQEFPDHPGDALILWQPTSRTTALESLNDFCQYRLASYGPYDEAFCDDEDFLFHSVLSTLLNSGLILSSEVIDTVIRHANENAVPLNSLESFVHRIFGCREYMRGMYQNFGEEQMKGNFWKHKRQMNESWYNGTTGVAPLDDSIKKAVRLSYNHHVERLGVLANMMNLSEIEPSAAYKWFMEMHMDSAEWITAPNVFGIGLHADGGILGTRPHVMGSHNLLKLSNYSKEDWCTEVDGLYWRFIDKHRDYFAAFPSYLSTTENVEKISSERKEVLSRAAEAFLARNTFYP